MKLPEKRVKITFNHNTEILDKLDAIVTQTGAKSRNDALGNAIIQVYNQLFNITNEDGEEEDTVINIVSKYKNHISRLRKRSLTVLNNLSTGKIGYKEGLAEIDNINKIIAFTRNMSRLDGDINNILFNARDSVRALLTERTIQLGDDRNDIIASQAEHRMNMDMIKISVGIED